MVSENDKISLVARCFRGLIFFVFLTVGQTLSVAADSLRIDVSVSQPLCYGEKSAAVNVSMQSGKAPFRFRIKALPENEIVETGTFSMNKYSIEISDTGKFQLHIQDADGTAVSKDFSIKNPQKLEAGTIAILKSKRGKGNLQANPSGGSPPYSYEWVAQEGKISTTQKVKKVTNGIYKVHIRDSNNCGPEIATIFFVEETKN